MKTSKFRLAGKKFSLTYSKCNATRSSVGTQLRHMFPIGSVELIVVSRELHADGTPHLHAFVEIRSKKEFTSPSCFDVFYDGTQYHGNYQTTAKKETWLTYVTKSDVAPYVYPEGYDIQAFLNSRKNHRKLHHRVLVDGTMTVVDYIKEHPSEVLRFLTIDRSVTAFREAERLQAPGPRYHGPIPNAWDLPFTSPLPGVKLRHLWLWSSVPNVGKTTFLRQLQAAYHTTSYDVLSTWQDTLDIGAQFILIDEFTPREMSAQRLNSLCDGTLLIPRKGLPARALQNDYPLVVVCSNRPINRVYPNSFQLVQARFLEFDLTNFHRQDF